MIADYFMYAFTSIVVCLVVSGVVLSMILGRKKESAAGEHFVIDEVREPSLSTFHAHHGLDRQSILDIKDRSRRLRDELVQCELAACKLFEVTPGDGSEKQGEIFNAMHNGHGWPKLIADYNLKHYGVRWKDDTRSTRYSV